MARKDKVVKTLVSGVEFLLKKNKVRFLKGKGRLTDPHTVEVELEDGNTERVTAASIILATGSVVAPLPAAVQVIGGDTSDADVFIDNREVRKRKAAGTLGQTTLWTSNEAVSAPDVPKRLVVLGAGAVGTEFAYTYRGLGAEVTLIEFMPNIVPPADPDLSTELNKLLTKAGIKIMTSTKVVAIDVPGKKLKYVSEKGDGELEFDRMLIGVGRRAYTDGLGLDAAGVTFDGKKIVADEYMRTNVPHIYAIGDAAGGGLVHVATREGEVAAGERPGDSVKMDYTAVPYCVYTEPEMAWTGLTEQQARDKGYDVQVGKFTFKSLGKAMAINENVGLVKIVTDAKYGEILGVHIVGPHATDLIHEACVSIKLGKHDRGADAHDPRPPDPGRSRHGGRPGRQGRECP